MRTAHKVVGWYGQHEREAHLFLLLIGLGIALSGKDTKCDNPSWNGP